MKVDCKSLKFQIAVIVVSVLLIIISVLCYSVWAMLNYNSLLYDEQNEENLSEVETAFLENYHSTINIMTGLSATEAIQRVLLNSEEYSYEISIPPNLITTMLQTMEKFSKFDGNVKDLYIIDREENLYTYVTYQEQYDLSQIMDKLSMTDMTHIYGPATINGDMVYCVVMPILRYESYPITTEVEDSIIGLCVATIDFSFVNEMLEDITPESGGVYLLNSDRNIVVSHHDKNVNTTLYSEVLSQTYSDNNLVKDNIHLVDQQVVSIKEIGTLNWDMVTISPQYNRIFFDFNVFFSVIIIWLICLVVVALICFNMLFNANQFILQLTKHMKIAEQGDLTTTMQSTGNSEFKDISKGFNDMLYQIGLLTNQKLELSTKLYREEVENINVTLLALQNQIKPHFLYNTIECIKNIGICYSVKEIEDLSTSLSFVLQYTAKQESTVPVRRELEAIQHYLLIHTIRFENRFSITYSIDDEMLNCEILKLCYEPLVENSVKHAFEHMSVGCEININVYQTQKDIFLSVKDNGIGISKDKITRLLSGNEKNRNSIGLSNVINRLRLFYKNEAQLLIESEVNFGTTVTVRIAKSSLPTP